VSVFKAGMTQEALDSHFHFQEHHRSKAMPTLEQSHVMNEQMIVAA